MDMLSTFSLALLSLGKEYKVHIFLLQVLLANKWMLSVIYTIMNAYY